MPTKQRSPGTPPYRRNYSDDDLPEEGEVQTPLNMDDNDNDDADDDADEAANEAEPARNMSDQETGEFPVDDDNIAAM